MGTTPTEQLLCATVAALMDAAGESGDELAKVLGATPAELAERQRGHAVWTLADCDVLAGHYGITVSDLLAGPRLALAARSAAQVPDVVRGEAQPCVLCGGPATATVEGFAQHLDPQECFGGEGEAEAAEEARSEEAEEAEEAEEEAPAAEPVPEPPAPAAPAPRRPPAPARPPAGSDQLPLDEVYNVVVAEATKAGGDLEAAETALAKRAITDAMALWDLTRVASRYDVLMRPPRPDILRKRSRNGADEIWEARPKWRHPERPERGAEVAVLDVNGAYLAALKTHLPHKQLEYDDSGAFDRGRSGVYLITPPAWEHPELPSPLGARETAGELWVTDATLRLLLRLSGPRYGLCEAPVIHESWTGAGSESLLERFRRTLATVRDEALAEGDALTLHYVKSMYSKFVATCGESSANRVMERPEWMHIIHSQAFANLWWKAHRAHEAGLTVVAVSGTDELHVTGGDWREVFAEGRGLTQVKLKTVLRPAARTAEGEG
ncbi:transcriptional regulator [Streptomyces polyrhachis]|uniref:Transcriptional regulator n=1 Tax=Streptomyces polyrhachis TaxID=1282885 RepID=A0ABW2GKB5_9ACTN